MIFARFLKWIYPFSATKTELDENKNIVKGCASLFGDDDFLQDWSIRHYNRDPVVESVKKVASKIKQILDVINESDYVDLKTLMLCTDMGFLEDISHLYYVTSMIVDSVKRLFTINNVFETKDEKELRYYIKYIYLQEYCNNNNRNFYRHYESSCHNYEDSCKQIVRFELGLIYQKIMIINRSEEKLLKKHDSSITLYKATKEKSILNTGVDSTFFDYCLLNSEEMLDKIMSSNNTRHAYLFEHITASRPNTETILGFHSLYKSGEFTNIFLSERLRDWCFRESQYQFPDMTRLIRIMDKPLVYNKPATALLITLFHFHSISLCTNVVYELLSKDNDMFEIVLTAPKINYTYDEIKEYNKHLKLKAARLTSNQNDASSSFRDEKVKATKAARLGNNQTVNSSSSRDEELFETFCDC